MPDSKKAAKILGISDRTFSQVEEKARRRSRLETLAKRNALLVGRGVVMESDVVDAELVVVAGNLAGDISCDILIVKKGATLMGAATCNSLEVTGYVDCIEVNCKTLVLSAGANFNSDVINCESLDIHPGAVLTGALNLSSGTNEGSSLAEDGFGSFNHDDNREQGRTGPFGESKEAEEKYNRALDREQGTSEAGYSLDESEQSEMLPVPREQRRRTESLTGIFVAMERAKSTSGGYTEPEPSSSESDESAYGTMAMKHFGTELLEKRPVPMLNPLLVSHDDAGSDQPVRSIQSEPEVKGVPFQPMGVEEKAMPERWFGGVIGTSSDESETAYSEASLAAGWSSNDELPTVEEESEESEAEVSAVDISEAEMSAVAVEDASDAEVSAVEVSDAEVSEAEVPEAGVSEAEVPEARVPVAEQADAEKPGTMPAVDKARVVPRNFTWDEIYQGSLPTPTADDEAKALAQMRRAKEETGSKSPAAESKGERPVSAVSSMVAWFENERQLRSGGTQDGEERKAPRGLLTRADETLYGKDAAPLN